MRPSSTYDFSRQYKQIRSYITYIYTHTHISIEREREIKEHSMQQFIISKYLFFNFVFKLPGV